MNMKKTLKFIIAALLVILAIAIAASVFLRYNVQPNEVYRISDNLIEDGGFENFNQPAGDCCNANPLKSRVFASQSSDSFEGKFSLNLTSEYQCACISKSVSNFDASKEYLILFRYKGDNSRICLWSSGDNNCLVKENQKPSKNWTLYFKIFNFTENSKDINLYLYTDSQGAAETNLYDSMQISKILPVYTSIKEPYKSDFSVFMKKWFNLDLDNKPLSYSSNEYYLIRTSSSNIVSSKNSEKLDDTTYLVKGKPDITLKFPYSELFLLIFLMLIVIRLLFKNQNKNPEKENEHEIDWIARNWRK